MKANFETGLKICSCCKQELPISEFYKTKSESDGLAFYCKGCQKAKRPTKEQSSIYWQKKKKAYMQVYLKTDAGHESQQRNDAKRTATGKSKDYQKKRYNEDESFHIKALLRARFHSVTSSPRKALEYTGCTIEELRSHLEFQWQEGMTWENYGKAGWHIDHIIPCNYFNLASEEDRMVCFNWRNLQPLWASENYSKQAKVPENVEQIVEQLKKEIYDNY